jgi:acyl-[acyl-carrier-protein]-phospholipid O-acyltransferase/long-chain-fatty-acid--[acyl-carrier-protein] ligase
MSSSHVQILNAERLPKDGVLVVPGQLEIEELHALEKLFEGRKISWLVEESARLPENVQARIESHGGDGFSFSAADAALPAAGEQLRPALAGGGVLIHVPGKVRTHPGTNPLIQGRVLKALCQLGLPTLPVAVHRPRETRLSFESPASLPAAILGIARPIPAADLGAATLRQRLLEGFEEAFSSRSFLGGHLGRALIHGLKTHRKRCLFDGADDSELPYPRLLAAAIVLSKLIREATDKPRIGVILPPGKAGMLANVAAVFAGKTPVNINFTAGHDAVQSAIRQADLDRFITADPFVRKLASFPWPPTRDLILIERELPALMKKIAFWSVFSRFLSVSALASMLGIPKEGGDKEAVLLFTSGSSGNPKGVVLTHRNILGNICQFGRRLAMPEGARILGSLPLFHSFGSTVTLWYPILENYDLVTYPNPIEARRLGELIAQHQIYLMLSTPTFLRGFMRRVDPDQLASLALAVTGAEKLPAPLAEKFEERFGIAPLEGYGLTETTPVTNFNLPDTHDAELPVIPSYRPGSVGHLMPGIAVRVTDPSDDDTSIPIDQQGVIWLRGANIFPGYLDNEKMTAEVLRDGWFRTGDIGRVDDEGFLYIEGRTSRFSKIGGEMVPHETVEAAVTRVLGLDSETERKVAIVGIPDEKKGEALALLSNLPCQSLEQFCIDLRYRLLDTGIPSLWTPKTIIPVNEIPLLASGKLDIKACQTAVDRYLGLSR